MKYLLAVVVFVAFWVFTGTAMESAGVNENSAYATFGAIWGMLLVGVLHSISD